MKRRVRSSVAAVSYPGYPRSQAIYMKRICEGYKHSAVQDVTIRAMCEVPSVYADLVVNGHMCGVIFTLLKDGRLDVESLPPRVKSIKGIDGVAKLSELYDNFAAVVQGLWAQVFDAVNSEEFKEVQ